MVHISPLQRHLGYGYLRPVQVIEPQELFLAPVVEPALHILQQLVLLPRHVEHLNDLSPRLFLLRSK